jgi:sRNA-binding carbon storage regulator CsrA
VLVLSRRDSERIRFTIVGSDGAEVVIWQSVLSSERGRVSLGIEAPAGVIIEREEVIGRKAKA